LVASANERFGSGVVVSERLASGEPLYDMVAHMASTTALADLPKLSGLQHIHHMAFRCRDAEQTRWFYEDVLGLPLKLALAFDKDPTGRDFPYMHLFFEMGDGNYLAFFDAPETADESLFRPQDSFNLHVALETDNLETLKAWKKRIREAGRPCFGPIDHEFVKSIYMYDPNGVQVEITTKTDAHDEFVAKDAAKAHEELATWTRRTRALKEKRFDLDLLNQRAIDTSAAYFSKPN
jgi:catechol 2,3-dioxygenase-like lactoylglutathione lyase family enzyme